MCVKILHFLTCSFTAEEKCLSAARVLSTEGNGNVLRSDHLNFIFKTKARFISNDW